ncbi:SDR family NAD(P)-dependent oxidoreductase [Thiohalobacter sp. IOR34]|uniref:SDR family NAD(P)-dependent oxidoreductase n=1 Tax=Thiohalobacter sp. IOR34 TaxID=3057176 RepID=UPI0025B1FC1C|nr:SDR family NAD(P)-dependent oxidoreductase [Thiohalobacter sp. IOR34]WJW76485.1 SDR family NAD(P)-dependent oxidoreductase [Thiohalobacter sp. IOR34]
MIRKTAFITGTSSGFGHGLAQHLLENGWSVYGCSRRGCDLSGIHDLRCDLTDFAALPGALQGLLGGLEALDLVILNAGVLGEIRRLVETPLESLRQIMEVNLWANKAVMDWLHGWGRPLGQVVMISSGAAVLGNKGWGGYALSKAALNMLAKLYAHEFPDTHISALAPGIIDTPMMDHLCEDADAEAFPALQRLRQARGTEVMPGPLEAATRLVSVLPELKKYPSGSFVDIRQILDPDGYASLYGR